VVVGIFPLLNPLVVRPFFAPWLSIASLAASSRAEGQVVSAGEAGRVWLKRSASWCARESAQQGPDPSAENAGDGSIGKNDGATRASHVDSSSLQK